MNPNVCAELLKRAYESKQAGESYTTSVGFDLCDEELDWLVRIGHIEIVKKYVHGGSFRITEEGEEVLSN